MIEKIMSFNLRFDNPEDGADNWKYRSDKVGKMINQHEPMVIGTQEGLYSMLKDLEKMLPNYSWFGTGRRGDLEDEFCAIFYDQCKLVCADQGQFWLSKEPDTPNTKSWQSALPRICTWGHFKMKEAPEIEFLFFNTHLDHISQDAREKGVLLIWEHLQEKMRKNNLPAILTGDFNSEPESQVIQFLSGHLEIEGQRSELKNAFDQLRGSQTSTYHDFKGGDKGGCIDYIFYSEDLLVEETIIDQAKIEDIYPSDHYPVISIINPHT